METDRARWIKNSIKSARRISAEGGRYQIDGHFERGFFRDKRFSFAYTLLVHCNCIRDKKDSIDLFLGKELTSDRADRHYIFLLFSHHGLDRYSTCSRNREKRKTAVNRRLFLFFIRQGVRK